mgnify:CR=1 FL=1
MLRILIIIGLIMVSLPFLTKVKDSIVGEAKKVEKVGSVIKKAVKYK